MTLAENERTAMSTEADQSVLDVAAEQYRLARLRQTAMNDAQKTIAKAQESYESQRATRDGHLAVVVKLGVSSSDCIALLKERRRSAGYDDERIDGADIK